MKFSPIRNNLVLAISRAPFTFKRIAVMALLAASLLFSLLLGYNPSHVGAQAPKPFDLVPESQDANGFDFNPRWAWQDTNPGVPDPNKLCFDSNGDFGGCTTDAVDFDEPDPWKVLHQTCKLTAETSVKGHVNWRPVAYRTRIYWGEFSVDGDYCFEATPVGRDWKTENNNGLTANRPRLHVEFHARETIKQFDTPWWKEFRKSVGIRNVGQGIGKKEQKFADDFVNHKRAIVIGLLNLDCVHNCYTEVHPVYAIAINIKTEKHDNGTVDEVWAIFARNWGNEGWCSQNQHNLNLETTSNRLSLTLPWGPDMETGMNALSYEVVNEGTKFLSSSHQATGPEISIAGNQGIRVSFVLPPAKDQARIHGELHLRWTMPTTVAGQPAAAVTSSTPMIASTELQREELEEKPLYDALGVEGRGRVERESRAGKPDAIAQRVSLKRDIGINRVSSILHQMRQREILIIQPAPPSQPPRVESVFDAEKAERDRRLFGIPPNTPH